MNSKKILLCALLLMSSFTLCSCVTVGIEKAKYEVIDKDGNFVKSWGERGGQPGNFNTPHGLVVDNNNVLRLHAQLLINHLCCY